MLMAGKQVTQPADVMQPITVEYLYKALLQPGTELAEKVQQLRALKTMQPQAYRRAKTMLPYIVCGKFQPAVRRKENFVYTQYLMLDADKLSAYERTPATLKQQLQTNPHILLMFTSPGNDGLKILLPLVQPVHDAGYYSAFYKTFAARFAADNRLHGIIDLVTSDVSRACFLSHDPEAYYNPNAQPIDPGTYLNPHDVNRLAEVQTLWKEAEQQAAGHTPPAAPVLPDTQPPDDDLPPDILLQIKQRISPRLAALQQYQQQKQAIQPAALEQIMPYLQQALADAGLQLQQARPIDYGRQLKITAGNHWCEVNLFYGKRGFRVVKTTKTGSHAPLADVALQALELFIAEYNNPNP